jgi:hypothetical protein
MIQHHSDSGIVGYVFPRKGDFVQFFKTVNGAKRNLIKRFENINQFNVEFWVEEN